MWKLKFDLRVSEMDSRLGGAYSDGISNIAIIKHLWDFGMNFRRFFNVLADARALPRNVAAPERRIFAGGLAAKRDDRYNAPVFSFDG